MKAIFFNSNQGTQEKEGVKPDYVVYSFPELPNAVRFFEARQLAGRIPFPSRLRALANGRPAHFGSL